MPRAACNGTPRVVPSSSDTVQVTRYILIAIALVAVAAVLGLLANALVLAFGGIVIATVLRAMSVPLARVTGLRHRWSLSLVLLGLVVLFGLGTWLFGSRAATQFAEFSQQLPAGVAKLRATLEESPVGRAIVDAVDRALEEGSVLSGVGTVAGMLVGGTAHMVLIVFLGIYFALDPPLYREGALRLLPPVRRPQVRSALEDSGDALQKWVVAQLVIMVAVGVLTGVGLAIAGVPLALLLGVLAGLLEFVPVVGPIAAAIPGLLLAFTQGPETTLYAAIVYVVVQQVESNVLTPLIQRWAVELPPVLALLAIVACGLLFGILGVVFATPIAVVAVALIQHLYVEDTLENSKQKTKKNGGRRPG
jgi:predicted PurR-regulated permease PerM